MYTKKEVGAQFQSGDAQLVDTKEGWNDRILYSVRK
jgi:hypothetical protein